MFKEKIMQKTTKFLERFISMVVIVFSVVAFVEAQTLDSFNPNPNINAISDIEPLPNGKIFVGGGFTTIGGGTRRSFARLNTDGTLDTTFPDVGLDAFSLITEIIIQPDGKILLSGDIFTINGQTRNRIARLNADGSLDTGFDAGFTPPVSVSRIALQPDGKIIVPGVFGSIRRVIRINANGSADSSFATAEFDNIIAQVLVQADGKVLACGGFTTANSTARRGIARFNANGTLDTAFNANMNTGACNRMTLLPDGKIYVGGSFTTIGGQSRTYFARLNADGSADTSFQTATVAGATNVFASVAIPLPNGKVIFTGSFDTVGGQARKDLARLNADGSLDTTFRNMQVSADSFTPPVILSRQADGKILLGGSFTTVDGQTRNRLARITTDDPFLVVTSLFDYDGDGKADLSVFRPNSDPAFADFQIRKSSDNNLLGYSWGLPGDKLAPADYDGDGKTDVAVWREAEGKFYILNSATVTVRQENFGLAGDILTVGDWDGDDKADPSVYRDGSQSYFYYRGSLNNPNSDITYLPWGTSGDKSVRGDFDGDGKQDATVFRPLNNTWYIRNSSNGSVRYDNWGISTDKFVCADYDGDSKTDLAVFRNGVWYIKRSSTNTPVYENFGLSTDIPVPADYDGDGQIDVAVFRDGIWYLNQSTSGFAAAQFGLSGDQPIPNAYANP